MKYWLLEFLIISSLFAQTHNKKFIKASGEYYHGAGVSYNAKEANDLALEKLNGQIAIRVESDFVHVVVESEEGLTENVKSILKTHSAATLRNVKTITTQLDNGQIELFCYIHKNEVQKIFDERKRLIAEMAGKALDHEKINNIAFALKLNYFAIILANSLPEQKVVYENQNYTLELPARINRLILNTRIDLEKDINISKKEREITVRMTYNGAPVSLLDFTFWDGSTQVAVRGRDGLATFNLFGASVNFTSLKIILNYDYYESRDEFNVVGDLWSLVGKPIFKSVKMLNLQKEQTSVLSTEKASTKNWKLDFEFEVTPANTEAITKSTRQFLELLAKKSIAEIEKFYAGDPFLQEKIVGYVKHNNPKPFISDIKANIAKTTTGYELRKIRVLHDYPSIDKQTTEYLVLDFNDSGKLLDFNTCISQNMFDSFIEQANFGNDWSKRHQIIKFVEKYRTAYLTRDINTVDMMFAEDALIIVGRIIQRKKLPENAVQFRKFGRQPDYETIKLSKQEFLQRQKTIFASQKDLFLDFSTLNINKKSNARGVYGVEMRQNYNSTTYSDAGHLFLLVDFEQPDPLIYVRSWQPNEWDERSLINLGNFRVHK